MNALLDFYSGCGTDHRGRTLKGILSFSDADLESSYDYIHWLFPLDKACPSSVEAPVVNADIIKAFDSSLSLQKALHRSFLRMLKFYGLVFIETPQAIFLDESTLLNDAHWLTPGNHNHERLTRMLSSLHLLGLSTQAKALKTYLLELAKDHPEFFSTDTLNDWLCSLEP